MAIEDDPFSFFEEMERELAFEIARQDAYIVDVEAEIVKQAFLFFPEYLSQKAFIMNKLQDELHEEVLGLNDTVEHLLMHEDKSDPVKPNEFIIPVKHKFETEEQEYEFHFGKYSLTNSPEFIQELKEGIHYAWMQQEFLFAIHNKIMETTFKHFPEIIELNGNSIRLINFSAYSVASTFTIGFYYVA